MIERLDVVGELVVLAGALLALISALGVVRLRTLFMRMHALTKASTGAIAIAIIGAELALRTAASVTTLALALALQFFTFPVGANLIARAVYRRQSDDDALGETVDRGATGR